MSEPTTTSPDAAPDPVAARLRAEVGLFRRTEQRRRFPVRLAVGEPGRRGTSTIVSGDVAPWHGPPWPPRSWLDAGTRFEVADRLVGTRPPGSVDAWLLRPGVPSLHDEDLAWLAAVRHACAAHGSVLASFWAVTRYGWLDPRTGESRSWKRLRVDR